MKPTRLFDFLYQQKEQFPQSKSIGHKVNDRWEFLSTDEVIDLVNRTSFGLMELGVQPGDKVAIASYKNRPEWTIVDLACQQVGAISVPLYPTISPREYVYILNDAGAQHAFVGGEDLVEKMRKAQPDVPSLKNIYSFDAGKDAPEWTSMQRDGDLRELERRKMAVKGEDIVTLIYTSGTTGNPKGVMLTHDNLVFMTNAVGEVSHLEPGSRILSFLPLCHIFERASSFKCIAQGSQICYTGTDNLGGEDGDLRAIKPHFFTTVPRLLEKVYEKIYNKGLELTGAKRKLFFWALSLTDDYEIDKQYSGLAGIKRTIADKLIFSKWREALGGEVKGILTGAAACPSNIMRVFNAAGIPVREAYGLTETSPGLTANRYAPQGALIGTVGYPLQGVELKIDDSDGSYNPGEGEVLATGPGIMMGYWQKPEATADVFTNIEGVKWFRTGDVGKMIKGPGGHEYLKITDRKKELLKTSGGKYVAPQPIENRLKEDFLIEQVMVVGEKQKFVSAIIVPAPEALKDWCENNGVSYQSRGQAIKDPKVIACYQKSIDKVNPDFSHIEQVKKFILIDADWEPTKTDGTAAELTPTMKLKRRVIRDKFSNEIEGIYS